MFDILNRTSGQDMLEYLLTSVKVNPEWTAGQHVQAWIAFEERYQARRTLSKLGHAVLQSTLDLL